MDKNRIWIIASVLVMIVVLGLGWFLGIAPQLSNAASAEVQRADVQALNAKQVATLAALKRDYANLGALNSQLAGLSESVPSDAAIPAFVDEIDAIAAASGVTVSSLAVADAEPYEPVSPPAAPGGAPTPAPTATPAPSATPAAGTTAPPTATPTAVPGMPPVTSAKLTSANFSSLAVTLTVKGTYAQSLTFVDGLQRGKRLFLVDGITTSTQSGSSGGGSTTQGSGSQSATITGLIFVVIPSASGTTSSPAPSP